jgi:hypothetical protein
MISSIISSSLVLSGRDWLAIHDLDWREPSPRRQRFQQCRKAAKQRWMQERRDELAKPLLKGVQ